MKFFLTVVKFNITSMVSGIFVMHRYIRQHIICGSFRPWLVYTALILLASVSGSFVFLVITGHGHEKATTAILWPLIIGGISPVIQLWYLMVDAYLADQQKIIDVLKKEY